MSGVKGENTVKVVGPDLHVNEAKADEIVDVMQKVPGVEDLGIFRSLGQPAIRITPDRAQFGRYGLNIGDVAAVVQAAIGGQVITAGLRRREALRPDLPLGRAVPAATFASIRNILVATPDGAQVPLGQIAEVVEEEGPSRHLPRRSEALRAGEVLRARARPRLDHRRGPSEDQGEGQAALRYPPRVGGRDEPAERGHGPATCHHSRSRCW